jgi:hypothetical protein
MAEPALQHDACHISSISKITSRRANGQVSLGAPGCPRSARINAACIFRIRQNRSLFSLGQVTSNAPLPVIGEMPRTMSDRRSPDRSSLCALDWAALARLTASTVQVS